MKLHTLIQGSPEWHALRASHNTASEASAMMGASKKTLRSELLRVKATGSEKEFSDWVQRNLLDKGHEIEAMAREIAERIIGAELFPVTGTAEVEHKGRLHRLLASFDGITEMGDTAWECKSWNESKADLVREGLVPDEDRWQVVQQLLVSGAKQCLYMVTDGTDERTVWCWATLSEESRNRLLDGWAQFNEDLANYQPSEQAPVAVAAAVESLPAVFVQVSGSVAVQNNLSTFDKALRHFLDNVLIRDPKTDQDFADLDAQIKAMKDAEDALNAAEAQMLAQVREVDDLKRAKDMLHDMLRQNRLASEKLLKAKKDEIRNDIRAKGEAELRKHIGGLSTELGLPMPPVAADFAGVMKNKRTLSSLQDAVDTELARVKIEANNLADKIRGNLAVIDQNSSYAFLFHDRAQLALKDREAVELIVRQRIDDHKLAEAKRLEDERERIRQEEAARLAAEQAASAAPADRYPDEQVADLLSQQHEPAYEATISTTQPTKAAARGRVVALLSKAELIKAVANGEVPDGVLMVDLEALHKLCNELGRAVPGTTWSKS